MNDRTPFFENSSKVLNLSRTMLIRINLSTLNFWGEVLSGVPITRL